MNETFAKASDTHNFGNQQLIANAKRPHGFAQRPQWLIERYLTAASRLMTVFLQSRAIASPAVFVATVCDFGMIRTRPPPRFAAPSDCPVTTSNSPRRRYCP